MLNVSFIGEVTSKPRLVDRATHFKIKVDMEGCDELKVIAYGKQTEKLEEGKLFFVSGDMVYNNKEDKIPTVNAEFVSPTDSLSAVYGVLTGSNTEYVEKGDFGLLKGYSFDYKNKVYTNVSGITNHPLRQYVTKKRIASSGPITARKYTNKEGEERLGLNMRMNTLEITEARSNDNQGNKKSTYNNTNNSEYNPFE